ncbi:MAG: roadblock/LC7 domain-containing protein [Candidatus Melainabacteria bacterium]|jgi:predicted regulator of Ras-like GTPase activity (Roadblock/LC7/MglB family)|nr:roadblock/LC7 domain-containing protein [Candidatus Melainabacteria bacterium]MBX9674781.1 roadblock/LC7 domain-containing protein [Candidatus Obscuribacterales bacterium]
MVTPESAAQLKTLLNSLNGKHGILGCLLVGRDGGVIATSLPAEVDIQTIGALSATLFSNNDVSIQRMNRGNLTQMTLLTDQGILHFLEAANHFLVVLTAKGQRINLEGLIRSVEEQGKTLEGMLG